jgi:hypothetical protein
MEAQRVPLRGVLLFAPPQSLSFHVFRFNFPFAPIFIAFFRHSAPPSCPALAREKLYDVRVEGDLVSSWDNSMFGNRAVDISEDITNGANLQMFELRNPGIGSEW